MTLLRLDNLSKSFGGIQAVQGVSLSLQAGEMLALIGPNGAGKSTTFNMVGGQLPPDNGRVLLAGQDITGLSARAIWQHGVGRTFQMAQTFRSFSVLENVQMALLSHHRHQWCIWSSARQHRTADALALLAQVGMESQAHHPCSTLAYGDVKRLELAMALAHNPRLLLMDEPTAGMAPSERIALMQLVRRMAQKRHMGVLFTEHSMDVVFGQSDRIAVLVGGQLLAQGTPQHIQAHAQVQAAYLGETPAFAPSCERTSNVAASPPLLDVQTLHAWYGAAHILHGVSLTVGRGEVVALMGRNGAGKSTTLKSIAGLVLPRTQGNLHFMGHNLHGQASYQRARQGVGYVPEERRIFTDLTVRENLATGQQPARTWPDGTPLSPWTPERLFQLFPNLAHMPTRLGGRMSGGEQQMLSVARTLMGQPYLVLLDEPSEGVAPIIVQHMASAIMTLKAQGIGILLSEQNLTLAQAVADRVYVLEKGQDTMTALLEDSNTRQAYLGL